MFTNKRIIWLKKPVARFIVIKNAHGTRHMKGSTTLHLKFEQHFGMSCQTGHWLSKLNKYFIRELTRK